MKCSACQSENDAASEICFTCGHSLVAAQAAITRGTLIADRYEVLSVLGRGGMGMVFKAHDRELDESVAIKTLRTDIAKEADVARRFRSEIKLARNIRHRNVCAIHEYGESVGLRYIAMEFVDGVDLRRLVRERGALSHREAFEIAIQAAQGLQAVHNAGIIHRDLKAANIMRDTAGRIRVMDFGIAKRRGAESTLGGHVVGTPEYMSPEQARGHKLDFRSDIYAMGIVIYEVFTGRVPFQGETPIATILMHLNEAPRLEGAGADNIPDSLVPVLRRALAKSPEERFGAASELAEALEAARAGAVGEAKRDAPAPRDTAGSGETALSAAAAIERSRARKWLFGTAGVVLAAAVAVLATRVPPAVGPVAAVPSEVLSGPAAAPPQAQAEAPAPPLPGGDVMAPAPLNSPGRPPRSPAAAPATVARSARVAPAVPRPTAVAEKPPPSTAPTALAAHPAANTAAAGLARVEPPAPAMARSAEPTVRQVNPPPTRRGDVVEDGRGVTPPRLLGSAEPEYPPLAKRLKRRATVLVRALVDENGKVVRAEVLQGDPSRLGFDEAAVAAAYRTSFKPAQKEGVPVKMWIELPVAFRP